MPKPLLPKELKAQLRPMPPRWYRLVLPRRDRPTQLLPIPSVDPALGKQFITQANADFEQSQRIFSKPGNYDITKLGEADKLDGPVEAALQWLVTTIRVHLHDRASHAAHVVDWWVHDAGLPFATAAVAEAGRWGLVEDSTRGGLAERFWPPKRPSGIVRRAEPCGATAHLAFRLARYLVAASDTEWREACATGRQFALDLNPSQMGFPFDPLVPSKKRLGLFSFTKLAAAESVDELSAMQPYLSRFRTSGVGDPLPTLFDRFGTELLPWLRDHVHQAPRDLVLAASWIDTPEAAALVFEHRMDHQVAAVWEEFLEREPERAKKAAGNEFEGQIGAKPAPATPVGETIDVPQILVSPPWLDSRILEAPPVLPDVTMIIPREMFHPARIVGRPPWAWRETEFDLAWLESANEYSVRLVEQIASAPAAQIDGILERWHPDRLANNTVERTIALLLSRLGLDAIEHVIPIVLHHGRPAVEAVLALDSARLAPAIISVHATQAKVRPGSDTWLLTNAAAAAHASLAMLVSTSEEQRVWAESALALLRDVRQTVVRDAVVAYGTDVERAYELFIERDGLLRLPKRLPKRPAWLNLDSLETPPRVLTSGAALPRAAIENLVTMLMLSEARTYAGADLALAELDPESVRQFCWLLFERWESVGHPPTEKWIVAAQGIVGTDDTVTLLVERLGSYTSRQTARAALLVQAIAEIGTDAALQQVYDMSRTVKQKVLRKHAIAAIDRIAMKRGLSIEHLADRLVPDLGLDADGQRVLALGARTVKIGLDEALIPFVIDDEGTRRTSLPRKRKDDDPEKLADAKEQFKALRRSTRSVAKEQITRLEQAMVQGRSWPLQDFIDLFVDHPLVVNLARRLVWGVRIDAGYSTTFRVAEDRTFADMNDEACTVDSEADIGIVHPVFLDQSERTIWESVFGDYEILQPFRQLGRDAYELSEAELESDRFEMEGVRSSGRRLFGLQARSWSFHGEYFQRDATFGGLTIVLSLDRLLDSQTASEFFPILAVLVRGPADTPATVRDLPAEIASEIKRDLAYLRAPSTT